MSESNNYISESKLGLLPCRMTDLKKTNLGSSVQFNRKNFKLEIYGKEITGKINSYCGISSAC